MGKSVEITLQERKLILKLFMEKKSLREIGAIIGRSHASVQTIIKSYGNTGTLDKKHRSGRPKIFTNREQKAIVNIVRKEPKISAPTIVKRINDSFGKDCNPQTVRNILNKEGFHGRSPRRKPFISKQNQKKRLNFAKEHVNKANDFWYNIVFSDESKYNIFGSDGHSKVWRRANTEFNKENIIPTVKHGGGNVMVWGCMSAAGVGNLTFIEHTMNKNGYLNILKANLMDSVDKMGLDRKKFMFQQDNDPKHTAKVVKEWLIFNVPKQLNSPPQSPDCNPIEHLWDLLERRIRKHRITSAQTLKDALLIEWMKITPQETSNLVFSMKNRLAAVIKARGNQTKY